MAPKAGILHDYDLRANDEKSARNQACRICDASPMAFQWSDYSGEAMCRACGCPYQLKWGSAQQCKERKYPYLVLRDELIEPLRAYYAETKRFTCLGIMVSASKPGLSEFLNWLRIHRPEVYK